MTSTTTPQERNSFLVPSGADYHLFVLLTNANKNNMHFLVPICSIKEHGFYDDTCIIHSGEHEFIIKDSYVYYKAVQERHTNHIIRCVENGSYIVKDDVTEELFTRICAGISTSMHIAQRIVREYQSWPD